MAVEKKRNSTLTGHSAQLLLTILVAAIVLFAVLNSVRFFTRLDLTESKAYTISDVSRSLFQEIPEQVQITYYVSERLQERFPQPQEITDLLREYAASSRGTITLRVVDPVAEDAAFDAESYGVVPQQLQVAEEGEQTFAQVYSGIVVSYLDRYETIPFVFATTTLEYEITSTIRDLVNDRTPTVRFLLGSPEQTLENDFSFAASQLAASYDVRVIGRGEPVPDSVDVLVVVGAEMLRGQEFSRVDEYLRRGGSVLIAVDPVEVAIDAGLAARQADNPEVFGRLESYGITVYPELILDEAFNQIVVQEAGRGFNVQRVLPYEHWIVLLEQYTSPDHPVTARFTGLDLYWASRLEVDEDSQAEIIAASTPQAWLMPSPYRTNPQESPFFRASAEDTRGQYGVVAVTTDQESGGRLLVVSDSDFLLSRLIQATQSGHNLVFLENAVQWLGNDEDLLRIRTRAARDLRLNNIEDPAAKRAVVLFSQALNIYVIPSLVILVGVLRFLRRRRRAGGGRGK